MPLLPTVVAVTGVVVASTAGFFAELDPAWIALIGTLFGGVVLQVANKLLNKGKTATTDAKSIRDELRASVTEQKGEIKELEDEVTEWRGKYYDLRDSYIDVQTQLTLALQSIKNEADKADKELRHKDLQ